MKNLFCLFLVAVIAIPLHANQSMLPEGDVLILNLTNDIAGMNQSDRHLTNSFSFGMATDEVPKALEWLLGGGPDTRYSIALSHYMYTPEDLQSEELITEDRPYAGWLFVRAQSAKREGRHLVIQGFEMGVVGPAALAEELQRSIHDLTDSTPAKGWDNQLNNEFGLNIFRRHVQSKRWDGRRLTHEILTHQGGSLGNVNTHLEVGGMYRVGVNIPDDMGEALIDNSGWGGRGPGDWSLYVFAGATGRYVIQDIFLDGNTFEDSHSVDKKDLVAALKAGIVIGYKNIDVGYANTYVTEQFHGQKGGNTNGLVFIRFRKRF